MGKQVVIATLLAFAISAVLGPVVIPFLRQLKIGQTEREDGVKEHLKKAGTPTMGGVMILAAIVIATLFFIKDYPKVLPILLVTVGFGAIGFIDDYLKVVRQSPDGLYPKQKMFFQILVTAIFAVYLVRSSMVSLELLIPFVNGKYWDLGWFAVPVLFIAVLGTVNGTNFTDGLDGLLSCVTLPITIFFIVISVTKELGVEPIAGAVLGALLGFLLYNSHPAKVFMGDTGSLAIGGFVVATAYMIQMPLFVILIGSIYLIEVLSVVIQVTYFKKTGGKRIFKMAPIHHHFELCGWSETKVVTIFAVVTTILCLIGYLGV